MRRNARFNHMLGKTFMLVAGVTVGMLAFDGRCQAQVTVGGYSTSSYSPGVVSSYYTPSSTMSYYSSPGYYTTPYTSGYYTTPYVYNTYYSTPYYYDGYYTPSYYGGGFYVGGPRFGFGWRRW